MLRLELADIKDAEMISELIRKSFKKQGVTLIELNIAAQFKSLQKFYEGLGYIPGERRSFSTLPL